MVEFIFDFTLFVKASCSFRGDIIPNAGLLESIVSRGGNSLHRPTPQMQTAPTVAQDLSS
ncbi:MAG: hypothetical protein MUF81_15540 [Verrucomicrobia bacterium]|jgi:hypothetical protein|nr:hypothetical protein [Verrucomicrobiota bacterium]